VKASIVIRITEFDEFKIKLVGLPKGEMILNLANSVSLKASSLYG